MGLFRSGGADRFVSSIYARLACARPFAFGAYGPLSNARRCTSGTGEERTSAHAGGLCIPQP